MLRRLHGSKATEHPDLLVGIDGADDAGVIRIREDLALVQTVDFFTPIIDEPEDWGRIAAANALSDVYAMGGTPLTALQLIGWPRDDLPFDLLGRVIDGGAEVLGEAGCLIVGGHSIDDAEPKYGFAVTGLVHPDDVMTNAAGEPGDVLVLTKPIGTGIIATAIKRGIAARESSEPAIAAMTRLNRAAADAARRVRVRCATDVTGFGLLGHLAEIVRASQISAVIDAAAVPLLPGVRPLAEDGVVPGGTVRNLAAVAPMTDFGSSDEATKLILADAQTSGGLLLAVAAPLHAALDQALEDAGVEAWTVGRLEARRFEDGPSGRIRVD